MYSQSTRATHICICTCMYVYYEFLCFWIYYDYVYDIILCRCGYRSGFPLHLAFVLFIFFNLKKKILSLLCHTRSLEKHNDISTVKYSLWMNALLRTSNLGWLLCSKFEINTNQLFFFLVVENHQPIHSSTSRTCWIRQN